MTARRPSTLLLLLLLFTSLLVVPQAFATTNTQPAATTQAPSVTSQTPQTSVSAQAPNEQKLVSNTALLKRMDELEKKAQDTMSMANTIVSWSGLSVAVLGLLLVVAGGIGLYEFKSIRTLKRDLLDSHAELREELSKMKVSRDALLDEMTQLDVDFRENNRVLLRTTYLMNEGVSSLREGDTPRAISNFKSVLEHSPDDYDTLCYLARAYGFSERFMSAEIHANKAIQVNEEKWLAYYILGEILRTQKKYDEAIVSLSKAVELEPMTNTFNGLAYALLKKSDYDGAIEAFKESLQLEDRYSAHSGIAKAYALTGKPELAAKHFAQAKKLAMVRINRGLISYGLEYFNAAFASMYVDDKTSFDYLDKAISKTRNTGVLLEQLVDYEAFHENEIVTGEIIESSLAAFRKKLDLLQATDVNGHTG